RFVSPSAARRWAPSAPASPSWSASRRGPTGARLRGRSRGCRRVGRSRRPDRSGIEKGRSRCAPNIAVTDITIHSTMLPHDDPGASLAFYRDTLGFEVRNDVEYGGMHWITIGPPAPPPTPLR